MDEKNPNNVMTMKEYAGGGPGHGIVFAKFC
jgi:hypothetical protein